MRKHILLIGIMQFSLLSIWGCGGADSPAEPVVSDGRSIVLKLDQSVLLGNATFFAVRSFVDSRRPDDASGIQYVPSVATVSVGTPSSGAPATIAEIREQREEYVKSDATGRTYRITLDNIEPARGLHANQIKQEDFRLTFRIQRAP